MALTKVTYSMIAGAPKNVRDYGATGDGTTDDTAAIRLALIGGGAIYFPAGTYLVKDATNIADAVVLAPASNSVLFGEGDLSILKLGAHSTIKHNIFRLDNKQNITICELKLDGNKFSKLERLAGFQTNIHTPFVLLLALKMLLLKIALLLMLRVMVYILAMKQVHQQLLQKHLLIII